MSMRFGKKGGGGRRKSARIDAPISTVISTVGSFETAALVDVSSTGARLQGDQLPHVGEQLMLRMESVETFATVAWSEGNQRGVHFDRALVSHELAQIRHAGMLGRRSGLSAEERIALAHWVTGFAR